MLLAYVKNFDWKLPTYFRVKIIIGLKIHTIREDKSNRWRAGMAIEHTYDPYNKKRLTFLRNKCTSTQSISITWGFVMIDFNGMEIPDHSLGLQPTVTIDGRVIEGEQLSKLALNDGFQSEAEFFRYFKQDFKGKIIHWTNHKY